jgi:hypothetical protein
VMTSSVRQDVLQIGRGIIWRRVQLIRPCLIGPKGLIRRSKLRAVGDARKRRVRQVSSLRREDAAGVIGSLARH